MRILSNVLNALFGLFVDDGSLALAILALVGVLAGFRYFNVLPSGAIGIALYLGLAILLFENVCRSVRRITGLR